MSGDVILEKRVSRISSLGTLIDRQFRVASQSVNWFHFSTLSLFSLTQHSPLHAEKHCTSASRITLNPIGPPSLRSSEVGKLFSSPSRNCRVTQCGRGKTEQPQCIHVVWNVRRFQWPPGHASKSSNSADGRQWQKQAPSLGRFSAG